MRLRWQSIVPLLLLVATVVAADDWPRFRGPNGSGVAQTGGLPLELSAAAAAWKVEVVFGKSSPIVVGDRVVLTGAEGDQLVTAAYQATTGKVSWRRSVTRLRHDDNVSESGPAVASPVSDGRRIYAFFPELGLVAYDLEGNEVWQRHLPAFDSYYGLASSPVVEAGVLILVCDQQRGPYILGVDTSNGEVLWRQERDVAAESWTTPVIRRAGRADAEVLVFGTFFVDAYAPRTGERLWRMGGVGFTPVASPVLDGERLFVVAPDQTEEFPMPSVENMMALDGDADGKLSESEMAPSPLASTFRWLDMDGDGGVVREEYATQLAGLQSEKHGLVAIDLAASSGPRVLWRQQRSQPYISTPIVYGGALFLIRDGGILTSYDPGSGEVIKRGRIEGAVEQFYPSAVAADGKLYFSSSTGSIAVVSAKGDWQTLGVSDLDEEIFASPALADGRMFIRTRSHLYAFGSGAPK